MVAISLSASCEFHYHARKLPLELSSLVGSSPATSVVTKLLDKSREFVTLLFQSTFLLTRHWFEFHGPNSERVNRPLRDGVGAISTRVRNTSDITLHDTAWVTIDSVDRVRPL